MRKITAIAVALGFLTSVSLPAYATLPASGVVKSDDLSAKKKKKSKKMEKKDEKGDKKSALGTDLSAKKKKKKDDKKMDKKDDKMEKKSEILYRIAA